MPAAKKRQMEALTSKTLIEAQHGRYGLDEASAMSSYWKSEFGKNYAPGLQGHAKMFNVLGPLFNSADAADRNTGYLEKRINDVVDSVRDYLKPGSSYKGSGLFSDYFDSKFSRRKK